MSFLLLRDARTCPACHRITNPQHFRECRNCGVMLFLKPINFVLYELDGAIRNYWMFHQENGWMNRDHLMEKRAKPIEREYTGETVPEGYGMHTTPEQIQAQGGKLVRKVKMP